MTLEKTLKDLIHESLDTTAPADLLADIFLGTYIQNNYHILRKIFHDSVRDARALHGMNIKEWNDAIDDIITDALDEITGKCI